jgi:hypothetical protein
MLQPEFRLSYTVKDKEASKNALLGKAVEDTKEKAAVLTQAADVSLQEIQSIDYSWGEIDFDYSPMRGDMLMRLSEAECGAMGCPGEITILTAEGRHYCMNYVYGCSHIPRGI